jgi:hypothetical protein
MLACFVMPVALEKVMLAQTKQLLQAALALPSEERLKLIEALTAGDLYRRADWVLVVRAPHERCGESMPCQHSWTFPVERVLKGEDVPEEVSVYGRYRDHSEIPACLRIAPGDGKFILFVPAGDRQDASVLGVVPWSDEAEALLTGR